MSLSVLVVDANIIIDLHISGLIIETFEIPYHCMTPIVIVEEMHSPKGTALIKLSLESVDRLVQEVYRLSFIYRKPSPKDIAALVLAHELGCCLSLVIVGLLKLLFKKVFKHMEPWGY